MVNMLTALRYMSDHLEEGIVNEIGDGIDPYCQRLQNSVLPVVIGTKVVMVISLIERITIDVENMSGNTPSQSHILRDKLVNLGFDSNWYGWRELEGLLALRHCFAHEFGKVTARQQQPINDFQRDLSNGSILDSSGKPVPQYFTVVNNEIDLGQGISNRLRLLSLDIINHLKTKGLVIQKSPL